MASDLSKAQFRGLLIPDPRLTTIWSAQSSFTQADPQPGVPEAQGNYDLALTASGDQPASRSYVVRTSEPGHPSKTGPASFMWKNEGDASTAYRGWDVPNAISTFMSITWSDSESAINPTVVTLDDQTVICAYHRKQNSGTENTICVRVMSAGSNTFGSEVELFSEVSAPSAAMLGTFGQHLVKYCCTFSQKILALPWEIFEHTSLRIRAPHGRLRRRPSCRSRSLSAAEVRVVVQQQTS